MTQLFQQQQTQAMTGRPMDERITSLEVRVGGIEDGIKTIVGKLDSRERMPWGVIVTSAGVVLTIIASIGSLAFRPLSDGITDLKATILEQKAEARRYVPREDLDVRFASAAQRRDDAQRMTDARIERAERDLDGVQRQVVPRDEHRQRWVEADREMDGIRARVGRIEDRIDKRLERLEAGRFKP